MLRILAFLVAMLMSGPVLAGPAWLCLCMESAKTSCCCPHEDHGGNTLEAGCCCAMSPSDGHAPSSPAGEAQGQAMSLDVASPNFIVAEDAPVPASANLDQPVHDTGPPPRDPALLGSVRLRP